MQDVEKVSGATFRLETGRKATIAVQIYQDLRRRITTGEYLPLLSISENELAATFGVSRTPVREALSKLEEDGLISIMPQYGTFVAPISAAQVASAQFVREALECAAVAEAAPRCEPEDAARLRAQVAAQNTAASEITFFEADERMHRELMTLAGQETAWHVVMAAKVNLDRIRHLSARYVTKRQAILVEHRDIVDRVVARDGAGASGAMRAHLRGVFASTERMMEMHPEFFREIRDAPRPSRHRRAPEQATR
jgi:DNA-binding GntR family transcriptional regulator